MIAIGKYLAAAVFALALSTAHSQSDPEYTATFAGSLTSISPRVTNVNSSGQMVSVATFVPGVAYQAIITDPSGETRLVGPQAPYIVEYGGGIAGTLLLNDVGQVAITRTDGGPDNNPESYFVDTDGMTTRIQTGGTYESRVYGMNAAGIVWGDAFRTESLHQGYFTGPNGVGMTLLGDTSACNFHTTCINTTLSSVIDVNIFGQVIGTVSSLQGQTYIPTSFVTGANGAGLFALSSLASLPGGALLTTALDIDDLGRILARGDDGRNYLLTPVPEPSTYALMLLGLAALFIRRTTLSHR